MPRFAVSTPQSNYDAIIERGVIARAGEFVTMANIENFPQALVGIEAHAILIGNGDENEIKKFFQTR